MTNENSNEEWLKVIEKAENGVPTTFSKYKAPGLGTPEFAKFIDHTLLKLDATKQQIEELCEQARKYNFKLNVVDSAQSVCVRIEWVPLAVELLQGSSVVVACVVGFHEGTQAVSDKAREAGNAIDAGASELDMVLNWVQLKAKDYEHVYTDIAAVRKTAPRPIVLKVILETSQLSQSDIIAGCKIAEEARADFVKTSTGFNGPGATIENVRLMKAVVGGGVKVKASGGVKTAHDCVAMMEAGAERIGTSNGVGIIIEPKGLIDQ